jgi:hypothetical protein
MMNGPANSDSAIAGLEPCARASDEGDLNMKAHLIRLHFS